MPATLVIQSHRQPLPFNWLQRCLDSVAQWADSNRFEYRFQDDALFELVAPELRAKTSEQIVIASDLARLKWIQQCLAEGYDRVVWCDADFLIFAPQAFVLPDADFALGREVWVQRDKQGRLRCYNKVHNALLMFCQGNHFLDFYTATAERLLNLNQGRMPPQFIGPKLLSALHNIAHCPVMENAGMLSPLLMRELIAGAGPALELFRQSSPANLAGANLSASLSLGEELGENEMTQLIERLQQGALERIPAPTP